MRRSRSCEDYANSSAGRARDGLEALDRHPDAPTIVSLAAGDLNRGAFDPFEWGPEWSRRARGIPLYAALRTLGRKGVAEMIERCCDLTRELVDRLRELPGVEVLTKPIINQGPVRFLDSEGDHDARTDEMIRRINATGEAWFGPTTWNGMRVMRISSSNYRTTGEDIDRVVAAVTKALEG